MGQEQFVSKEQYEKLLSENEYLKQQLSELKRMIFGSKSERFVPIGDSQLSLFDFGQENATEKDTEQISYTREKAQKEKKNAVRAKIPAHLPRVEEIIEPEDIQDGSKKIGEEITEILEYNPARVFVRKIIRPKYANPRDEGVVIAELPSLPIPKGNAGASMLAYIMVSKFVDHLPYYRQIQILKRQQLILSDSTINGWFNATANLLEPLYDTLAEQVLQSDYIQADESPIGVQDSHKKGALHTGYQWVYRSPIDRLVLFKYHHSRERKAPEAVLKKFSGSLQTDGYQAYQNMKIKGEITLLACMAHARRYFEKALDNDKKRAGYVLEQMQRLYDIERDAREREINFETRRRYRQLYARPVLAELETWLKDNISQTLPKSAIGKAIAYTLNLWPKLKEYTNDGKYEIDNNLIENAIRPLALGRKNYLFAGSHKAAQRAAMMYSFFATCKINYVEPLAWLTDVLNRIPEHKANKLTELLPQNWEEQSSPQ
ncbi:MAG: IS66 family transposase [Bacteroidetes bacterium]|nr:MAG: IS66 family transposase [Bacteroidota bacterium]